MTDLYDRQAPLDLEPPRKVAVAGCGGIGSWLALDLALVGSGELVLIDPDVLEISNLGRTPYYPGQVGCPKVVALAELITERRPECLVLPYPTCAQAIFPMLPPDLDYFLDCTDSLAVKQALAARLGERYLKLGYDGFQFVLDGEADLPWEDGVAAGYGIIPSFFGVPQLLANLVATALVTRTPLPRRAVVGDIRELVGHVLGS